MKKVIIAVVLLLLVAVAWAGATYYIGATIEKRYAAFIVENARFGPISLFTRSYQRGFLSSRAESLVELTAFLPTKNPDETPVTQTVQLVLTHDIYHGPLLIGPKPGGKRFALAMIDTGLTIPAEANAIDELIKEIPELKFSTATATIALNGRTEGRIVIPPFSKQDDDATVDWGGFNFAVDYAPGAGTLDGTMEMPKLNININDANDTEMTWQGTHARFNLVEALPMLFVGKTQMSLGDMKFDMHNENGGERTRLEIKGVDIDAETSYDGHLVHANETIFSDGFVFDGEAFGPIEFQFELKNMNAQALSDFQQTAIAVYRKADQQHPEEMLADLLPMYGDLAFRSLPESPEFNLNRLYFNTPMGEASGVVKVKYDHPHREAPTELAMFPQYLPFIDAVADLSIDKQLVKTLLKDIVKKQVKAALDQSSQPQISELELEAMVNRQVESQLQAFVTQGFIVSEGEKLGSHVTFSSGQLQVNGKVLPLFGG